MSIESLDKGKFVKCEMVLESYVSRGGKLFTVSPGMILKLYDNSGENWLYQTNDSGTITFNSNVAKICDQNLEESELSLVPCKTTDDLRSTVLNSMKSILLDNGGGPTKTISGFSGCLFRVGKYYAMLNEAYNIHGIKVFTIKIDNSAVTVPTYNEVIRECRELKCPHSLVLDFHTLYPVDDLYVEGSEIFLVSNNLRMERPDLWN